MVSAGEPWPRTPRCSAAHSRTRDNATGRVAIELCHSGARVRLYDRPCFEWELARGFIRISYPFEQAVENLEVRLRVPNGFAGSVRQLSIQRVPDEPS